LLVGKGHESGGLGCIKVERHLRPLKREISRKALRDYEPDQDASKSHQYDGVEDSQPARLFALRDHGIKCPIWNETIAVKWTWQVARSEDLHAAIPAAGKQ